MTVALAAGLLTSRHAHMYDCVLLLPALFSVILLPAPEPLRIWALALLTPVPYLFLLVEPLSRLGRPLIAGFAIAFIALLCLSKVGRGQALRHYFEPKDMSKASHSASQG